VDSPFNVTLSNTTHYKVPAALIPSGGYVINAARGFVSNTNLTSVKMMVSNSSIAGLNFYLGEKVNMVDVANTVAGANGIVSFSNSSTVYVSAVQGTWQSTYYILGQSSQQRMYIQNIASNKNVTIANTTGIFNLGERVFFKFGNSYTANALLTNIFTVPNDTTEYQIGPTIKVSGTGTDDVVAVGIVNTNIAANNSVCRIEVINPGSGWTDANVAIYANSAFGSNATANAIVSPITGHGYDPHTELGAIYAGISTRFDTISNELYSFPGYSPFRRVGIIADPQFQDVQVTLSDYDRVNLTTQTAVTSSANVSITTWYSGEVIYQPSTKASGVVSYGNSTFVQVQGVHGTFNTAANVYSYYSNTTANVTSSNTVYFSADSGSTKIISEVGSGASGLIVAANTTVATLSNVVGQFVKNDYMYNSYSNAYAKVTAIKTANGTRDISDSFGDRFSQTLRFTLSSNTAAFQINEYVNQPITGASGKVVSTLDEVDLTYTSNTGAWVVGTTVTDTTTGANGIISFANSTYLKITSASNNRAFVSGHQINNNSTSATITNVYPVLVLNGISGDNKFQVDANSVIIGQTSGATGYCNNSLGIMYPELVRNTGKVIYLENLSPVTRTPTTKEDVRLVIKF
jgi:hypothetical protein